MFVEDRACKPDFVSDLRRRWSFLCRESCPSRDCSVSGNSSSQPESSPGRVCRSLRCGFRFLLGLAPDGGCLSRRVAATLVRFYIKSLRSAPFHQFRRQRQKAGGSPKLELKRQYLSFEYSNCLLLSAAAPCCIVSVALSRLSHRCASGRR